MPADIPPTQASQLGFFTFTGTYAGQSYLVFFAGFAGYSRFGFGDNSGDVQSGEQYVFWQHLSEAKMISGLYGGSPSGANYLQPDTSTYTVGGKTINPIPTQSDRDIFLPPSKLSSSNSSVYVYTNRPFTLLPYFNNTSLPNAFYFYTSSNIELVIDSKIDDGIPNTGTVRDLDTGFNNLGDCSMGTSPNAYDLTLGDTTYCRLHVLW